MLGIVSNNLRNPRVRQLKTTVPVTPAAISAAFTARVVAAGGSLTTTEQNAVLALVTSMTTNGTWSAMKAIYPMVGGSAASCAQNLVSASHTGIFTGGWVFNPTGARGNGVNTYMNTFIDPSVILSGVSSCLSFYSRTASTGNYTDMGSQNGFVILNRVSLAISYSGTGYFDQNDYSTGRIAAANATSTGWYAMSRTSNVMQKAFKNNAQLGATNTATMNSPFPASQIYVGGFNYNDGVNFQYTNRECAFAHISNGLSDAQVSSLYTNVQTFQTSLSRQV